MSVASKKNTTGKKIRRTRTTKPVPESKYIGLAEKNAEAERIYRSLVNPELLRK